MILRYEGRFLKVIKVRSHGDNSYSFECKDLDSNPTHTSYVGKIQRPAAEGFAEAAVKPKGERRMQAFFEM